MRSVSSTSSRSSASDEHNTERGTVRARRHRPSATSAAGRDDRGGLGLGTGTPGGSGDRRHEPDLDPTPAGRNRWSRLWPELVGAGAAALLAVLGAAAALRLWKGCLNIPITSAGDGMLTLMIVKGMQDNGWYQFNPYLGYPFGQDFAAYPATVGDLWHMVTLKVLSLFLTPAGAVNTFYIGGFAVIAAVAYFCLRYLSVSRPLACALAVAYALAPYHFLRGESHLLLSAYYALPIAVVLAVSLYTGRNPLLRSPRHWGWAGWGSIAGAVLLAGTGCTTRSSPSSSSPQPAPSPRSPTDAPRCSWRPSG